MPYVRISLAGPAAAISQSQVARLQQELTELMGRLLGKQRELTVVSVSRETAADWSVGGVAATAGMAQLRALITEGTNSADEKQAFIAAAHALLMQVLEQAAGPIYVVVDEVPAGNWGYDGLSQAARRAPWQGRAAA